MLLIFIGNKYLNSQVNRNGLVYGTFSDVVTKRHLNGRKQTVSIRNFGHSITAPYFPSDTVTIRLFTYINGPYYCARKYGPYRSTWDCIVLFLEFLQLVCHKNIFNLHRCFFSIVTTSNIGNYCQYEQLDRIGIIRDILKTVFIEII